MAKKKVKKLAINDRPGSGVRFKRIVAAITQRPGFEPQKPEEISSAQWQQMSEAERKQESARRIAAAMGRRKYGKAKMAQWAAKGIRRAKQAQVG